MTDTPPQEEIQVSGSLLNITLFEDKIMKNFLLISNKLHRLETLYVMQQKQKAMEKEFKFLTMKVDSIVEKLPKDAGSLTRNDARNISKQTFYDILNSNEEKLKASKYHNDLLAEIDRVKDMFKGSSSPGNRQLGMRKEGSKTSFTAGQILRDSERDKDKDKEKNRLPRESLQEVLDDKEMEIVSQIVQTKSKQRGPTLEDLSQKFEELTKIVEELRLGRGYASYLERQAEKLERFQKFEEKSRQTARKLKDKPIQLQGIKAENVKGEILKSGLLNEVQRMELNKEEIARHQLMQKRTFHSYFPKDPKGDSREYVDSKEVVKGLKQRDPYVSTLRESKDKQGFKRSQSIRKLDKLERRLKVDDLKDLNSVLREIELRIEGKVSHDIFMGFVKDIEEKLETIRISKDSSADISQLRKNVFVLESKVQSVVGYLQSVTQQDEALIVRKQWNCVSCDKSLEKYQGKVGQHLNWESMSAKKLSPTKAGAFGQTGQLAAKIRNLMEGNDVQQ